MHPLEAIWLHHKTPDPALPWPDLKFGGNVWRGQRQKDVSQTVLTWLPVNRNPNSNRFDSAILYVNLYVFAKSGEESVAFAALEERELAVLNAYDAFRGESTSAPGLTFADAWHAEQVQANLTGLRDIIPVTGGSLCKTVVSVALINLYEIT
jgi:hypothetical protein